MQERRSCASFPSAHRSPSRPTSGLAIPYKRILGYVYLPDGKMANEEMARTGYATSLVYPPNVRYVERIRRAVEDARKAKRGLWATNFFDCSPRDYRAGRCSSYSAGAREDRSTPYSRR